MYILHRVGIFIVKNLLTAIVNLENRYNLIRIINKEVFFNTLYLDIRN